MIDTSSQHNSPVVPPQRGTQWIETTILPRLSEFLTADYKWSIHEKFISSRESWIFRASAPGYPTDIAIKVFKKAIRGKSLAQGTYKTLQDYKMAMSSGASGDASRVDLTVPHPIAVFEDDDVVIMEWVTYPRLSSCLMAAGLIIPVRKALIKRAASWLQQFHQIAPTHSSPLDISAELNRIKSGVGGKEKLNAILEVDPVLKKCHTYLLANASRFDKREMVHGKIHGDFTTTNLLVGHKRTVGLDFDVPRDSPITQDICRFLMYLDVYKTIHTFKPFRHFSGNTTTDFKAFLNGYGNDEFCKDQELFCYLQLIEIVRRLFRLQSKARITGVFRTLELIRLRSRASYLLESFET